MEDVGEPLVDVNFGHGRYEHIKCVMKIVFCMGLNIMIFKASLKYLFSLTVIGIFW